MVIAVRTEQAEAPTAPGLVAVGELVVIKEARTDADVARLDREAAVLRRAAHPRVVELVAVAEHAIVLRHAGSSLARMGALPLDQTAGVISVVADVVDALHRQGVAHNAIEASHVVVDTRGLPRLCGFGAAGDHDDAAGAEDVAAVGRLLARMLQTGEHLAVPGMRPRHQKAARKALEAVAASATRPTATERPSARQLAKAVHGAVPSLRLPTGDATIERTDTFAALPDDIDPTAELGWTADDLTWLAGGDEDDDSLAPADGLDASDALAAIAARPSRRLDADATTPVPEGGSPALAVALPEAASRSRHDGRRRVGPGRVLAVSAVLVLGVAAGTAGARVVRPFGGAEAGTPRPVASVAADGTSSDDADGSAAEGDDDTAATMAPTSAAPTTAPSPDVAPATDSADPGPAPTTVADAVVATPPPAPIPAEVAAGWPGHCVAVDPAGPDVDGDGCPEAILVDDRLVTIAPSTPRARTVSVGDTGDLLTLGDWTCDGIDTPALLRPSTGEVFVFERWVLDAPVEVVAATVVAGGTAIRTATAPTGGACDRPLVDTEAGAVTVDGASRTGQG